MADHKAQLMLLKCARQRLWEVLTPELMDYEAIISQSIRDLEDDYSDALTGLALEFAQFILDGGDLAGISQEWRLFE